MMMSYGFDNPMGFMKKKKHCLYYKVWGSNGEVVDKQEKRQNEILISLHIDFLGNNQPSWHPSLTNTDIYKGLESWWQLLF